LAQASRKSAIHVSRSFRSEWLSRKGKRLFYLTFNPAAALRCASQLSNSGLTSLAGLPLYLDLIHASGLGTAIRQQVRVAGAQGWLDIQMVLAVIFLNLAGGD